MSYMTQAFTVTVLDSEVIVVASTISEAESKFLAYQSRLTKAQPMRAAVIESIKRSYSVLP